MPGLAELIASLIVLSASWLLEPRDAATAPAVGRPAEERPYLRARGDHFELVADGVARRFTIHGVNLGAGAPGHFPGEFAFSKDQYRRYLRFARELHANAIRVYTLHPPAFYEALREENTAHPERPLWLFHGVWTELPDTDNLWAEDFTRGFERDIRGVIDAVHGGAEVAPRPGHAAGRYTADVSPWLAGWILGREWEPYAVRATETLNPDSTAYRGAYFAVEGGTAVEAWIARILDVAVAHERERYGVARAVSFVTWPTLDVIRHPTESEPGGREVHHDEDRYSVDPRRIRPLREAALAEGFLGYFASYHVYPYYPDFLNLDPGYGATRDRHGPCNYAGYLADLKAHSGGLPIVIAEYGVPSSRGISHLQPQGLHHGGASEEEQGRHCVRLLEDIQDADLAGSLLFALVDEWFKGNWLTWPTDRPRDRDRLWHNLLDAEEGYGLIAFDPPPRIRVDGDPADWSDIAPFAEAATARAPESAPEPAGAGRRRARRVPRSRTLIRALYATSDQGRLYLRLDLDPRTLRGSAPTVGVAFDVLDPRRGDTRLPAPLDATWSRGAEFVLVIRPGLGPDDPESGAGLFADRQMNWSRSSVLPGWRSFEPNDAPLRPVANDDGLYTALLVTTNRERHGRTGEIYPALQLDWGRLAQGREAPGADASGADPRAEWWLDRTRGVLEVALPWGLLNVGDPSSRSVLDDVAGTDEVEVTGTQGIGLLAWATRAEGFRADSLGPTRDGWRTAEPGECHFLGAPGTRQLVAGQHVRLLSPDSTHYSWDTWEWPITRERIKASAGPIRKAFQEMESLGSRALLELDARRPGGPPRARPRRRAAGAGRPRPAGAVRPRAGCPGGIGRRRRRVAAG